MIEVVFLGVVALVWLVFASVQDFRTREIANWLNYSLIVFAMGFRFFYSLFSGDFGFLLQGAIGLGIFVLLGTLFYYGRFFAGGDAKLMMALGSVLPFSVDFFSNVKIFVLFLFLFLFAGGIYGLGASVYFGVRNFESVKKEILSRFRKRKIWVFAVMGLGLAFMVAGFFESIFLFLGVVVFLAPYLWLFASSVDESAMVRMTKVGNLTEGDWLFEDVDVGGKVVKANWEGLSNEEIGLLKENRKDVLIRNGIPFAVVFLVGYLAVMYFYVFNPIWLDFMEFFRGVSFFPL